MCDYVTAVQNGNRKQSGHCTQCVCVCVCVCGQERELLMLPAPDQNMDKQLWGSSLRVDDELEPLIDFKHRKWEFLVTANVRDANC